MLIRILAYTLFTNLCWIMYQNRIILSYCYPIFALNTICPPPSATLCKQQFLVRNDKMKLFRWNFHSLQSHFEPFENLPLWLISPAYSGKQMLMGTKLIFLWNKSFLLRKRIIEVSLNHLLLQIDSKRFMLSTILFCGLSRLCAESPHKVNYSISNWRN